MINMGISAVEVIGLALLAGFGGAIGWRAGVAVWRYTDDRGQNMLCRYYQWRIRVALKRA